MKAEVCERTGPLWFKVRLNNGQVVYSDVDNLGMRHTRHSSISALPNLNIEELSAESVDFLIVASQTDTNLVENGTE